MNAYLVHLTDDTRVYVLAPTRNKAIVRAIKEDESLSGVPIDSYCYTSCRATRVPDLDGETLTYRQLVMAGRMWVDCWGCAVRITTIPDEWGDTQSAPVWDGDHTAWCSYDCRNRDHGCVHQMQTSSKDAVWLADDVDAQRRLAKRYSKEELFRMKQVVARVHHLTSLAL